MTFDELLEQWPLPWGDKRLQALHEAFAAAYYKDAEIEMVWKSAGLGPQHLFWQEAPMPRWMKGFDYAASQRQLAALITTGTDTSPALASRVEDLRGDEPALPAQRKEPPPAKDFQNFSDGAVKEKQIVAGMPTLRDIRFFTLGLARAEAVCRIDAHFGPFRQDGTGFRIGNRTVLTNHHVVYDEDDGNAPAKSVQMIFGHELDEAGELRTDHITVNADLSVLRGDESDDWAVLTTKNDLPAEIPILPITGPTEPPQVDDRVCIIQHPKGLPKKIALYHNLIRYVDDNVVQYWTDTDVGSSGSPVFNEDWEVVALHHAAVKKPDDEHGYANQGRAIARINALVTGASVG